MPISVELGFDAESEKKIREIWKVLYDKKLCEWMYLSHSLPHITLCIYEDSIGDKIEFIQHVESFGRDIKQFKLQLSNLGVFNTQEKVIFLSPKVSNDLLNLHKEFFCTMDEYKGHEWMYYRPQMWIPHCTTAIVNEELWLKSIKVVEEIFKPMEVTIEKINILEFYPISYLKSIYLGV